ncbi:cytochrome c-type biogenesis protein [Endozoicomonas sp.]|uniref:cytochrome c-type biogenesis protein n=1 Tax=Endozoicomonas sp. TaxID=1892382 RepID=UPI002885A34D|nr:cytochrome c-type biogenesis protein [Endozoicomonas sp.]
MKKLASQFLFVISALLFFSPAYGVIDSYEFTTAEQEQRFFELTNELRCPKCQNQTIADSNAPIAQDLRREVHRMVNDGADNQTVIDFMLSRYGDFVLYKPQMSGLNLVLWLGPVFLLLVGFMVLLMVVRKHRVAGKTVVDDAEEGLSAEQQQRLNKVLDGAFDGKASGGKAAGDKE